MTIFLNWSRNSESASCLSFLSMLSTIEVKHKPVRFSSCLLCIQHIQPKDKWVCLHSHKISLYYLSVRICFSCMTITLHFFSTAKLSTTTNLNCLAAHENNIHIEGSLPYLAWKERNPPSFLVAGKCDEVPNNLSLYVLPYFVLFIIWVPWSRHFRSAVPNMNLNVV